MCADPPSGEPVSGGRDGSLLVRRCAAPREGDACPRTRLKRSSAVVPAGTRWGADPPTEESGGGKAFVEDAAIDSDLKMTSPLNRTFRVVRQRHARFWGT